MEPTANRPGIPPDGAAVTTSDLDADDFQPSYIRIAVAGAVKVKTESGNTLTIPAVAAGEYLGCRCVRVFTTDTDVASRTGITRYF